MALHSTLTQVDGIHTVVSLVYADATERLAATGLVDQDFGKVAYQEDDGTMWLLASLDPVTWTAFGGAPPPHAASHNAGGSDAVTFALPTTVAGGTVLVKSLNLGSAPASAVNGAGELSLENAGALFVEGVWRAATGTDLASDSATSVLAVTTLGADARLGASKTFSAVVGVRVGINTTGTPANAGFVDITTLAIITTDASSVATVSFPLTISPDTSKVASDISAVTATIAASTGGFTVTATRVSGVAQRVTSCEVWFAKIDEVA